MFIISDYSQIELRIAANFSQDPVMMEAFRLGIDLHTATAARVFDVPLDEVTADQRYLAKRLNFGVVYGIGAQKFSALAHVTLPEAEAIIAKYFDTHSRLDTWLRYLAQQAMDYRFTRTASGRRISYAAVADGETWYEQRKILGSLGRNGRNAPIQGTSADIIKVALRGVYDELRGTSGKIVNVIHDEIVVECDEGDAATLLPCIEGAMVVAAERFVKRVPIVVESAISRRWLK